jgi:hypothetical protein
LAFRVKAGPGPLCPADAEVARNAGTAKAKKSDTRRCSEGISGASPTLLISDAPQHR